MSSPITAQYFLRAPLPVMVSFAASLTKEIASMVDFPHLKPNCLCDSPCWDLTIARESILYGRYGEMEKSALLNDFYWASIALVYWLFTSILHLTSAFAGCNSPRTFPNMKPEGRFCICVTVKWKLLGVLNCKYKFSYLKKNPRKLPPGKRRR